MDMINNVTRLAQSKPSQLVSVRSTPTLRVPKGDTVKAIIPATTHIVYCTFTSLQSIFKKSFAEIISPFFCKIKEIV